ncbi:hypothetical protein LP420_05705 [Massilia sp. B-10]|nr:hypothetical protein LP420_05705 [Massilia sp. B-10]
MARPNAEAKANYAQAKDQAAAAYQVARAKCDAITGNPKEVCVAEAKAARVRAEQEAKRCTRTRSRRTPIRASRSRPPITTSTKHAAAR